MAGRAAKMAAKAFGKKAASADAKQDKAMIKAAVKPSALKKPVKMAVGGVAKMRLGQSTPAGKQKAPPRGPKRAI